ncbi:hypothetical protein GGX14DRAFT_415648 [Mycena pura]|uniref:Uncharacterized protein n=1 Tax=Mycena pura TaxID=153505 RepID=A0AAD6YTH9_9AGAR|nr:hypothetical protein GGX14DRAFT_415648 [Mycena pura]
MDLQPPTPKELALRALKANQDHQYALAQQVQKLDADLAELDKLLAQADVEDDASDLESDFYIPDAKPPVGPIRNFLHPESPFYEDAMKRTRYLNFTVRHSMSPKEVDALKGAVNAELRRVEQLEGSSSSSTDSQMVDKLNWPIIAEKVSDLSSVTRTAEECKIKWIGDLSTAINRGPWSPADMQALQKILKRKPRQASVNWVEVAQELGTNRLPIDCMRQGLERTRFTWNADSDQKLIDAVNQYGTAWSLVAKYVSPDVTPAQCSSRYQRSFDPTLRHGAWSVEEDKRLVAAVAGYGKSWAEVATVVPGRTNEQCRDRWTNTLDPAKASNKKDDWTEELDKRLMEAVKTMGRKWKDIGAQLGRPAKHCQIRYGQQNNQDPQEEEDDVATPSGHASKCRAKDVSPQVPPRPRPKPRPLPKNDSARRGTKRATPDLDEYHPQKKRAKQNSALKEDAVESSNSQPSDDSVSPRDSEWTPADKSSPSNTKKKRMALQVDDLPRRRSARLGGKVTD